MKMKKVISRIMAFALTMIMVLGMSMSALAESTVTINGTKARGNVLAFKLFDRTQNAGGTAVAYTLNEKYAGYFSQTGKAGDGKTGDDLSAAAYKYVASLSGTDKTDDLSQFAADMWSWLSANNKNADVTEAATSETTTMSLEAGYYLVFPAGASVLNGGAKSPAMLMDVNGTTAFTANLKSEYPTVKKTVTVDGIEDVKGTVKPGDEITYTITSKVPDVSGYNKGYTFIINDTLSEGLTFNTLTSVKIDNTNLASENYKLTHPVDGDAQKLTVELTNMATGAEGSMTPNTAVYPVGATITVTYTVTVNENAVTGINPNTNTASVTYSNDPSSEGTGNSEEVHAKVYTFGFDIFKYTLTDDKTADEDDNRTALAGAQFKLYAANGDAKGTEISLVNEGNGVYRQAKENGETATKAECIETDADGKVTVKGLKEGTYFLTEIKAPDGYNKMVGDIKIEIKDLTYSQEDPTELVSYIIEYTMPDGASVPTTVITNDAVQIPVLNKAGTILPSTGGNGGIVFTVVGVVIIGFMMLSDLKNKKRKKSTK